MFQLISDGSCDLSPAQLEASGITVVPFYISLDGKTYQKEIEELSVRDFYATCISHPDRYPRTSMPSVQDYMDAFEPPLSQEQDILCCCITQKFSGSFQSACVARDLLREKNSRRVIRVVDSTLVTGLQGLLLLELARFAREGHSLEEIVKKLIQEQAIDPERYSFALGWGFDPGEAEPFFQRIRQLFLESFGTVPDSVPIQIGATIGVHTGPYPVGIGFIEKA